MGKSGYLPDISSAFAFWRSYAVNCLDKKKYRGAAAGLYNINSLLSEDYIVSIDTESYHKQTNERMFYICNSCESETPRSKINIFEKMLCQVESIILEKNSVKVWECPKCKKLNDQISTTIIKDKLVSPYYRRVVPECPDAGIGLQHRFNFPIKFEKWFYLFLEELQHQLALYRIEYISQHGEDMTEPSYKDKGDL